MTPPLSVTRGMEVQATRSVVGVGLDDTFLLTIWKSPGKSVEQDGGVPVFVCAETVATRARRARAYFIIQM